MIILKVIFYREWVIWRRHFWLFWGGGCSQGEVFSLIVNKRLSFWQTMLLPWRTLDTVNSASSSRWECALGLYVGALRADAVLMCRICWRKLFFSSQKPMGLSCSSLSLEFFFPFAYCVCDKETGEKHRGRKTFSSSCLAFLPLRRGPNTLENLGHVLESTFFFFYPTRISTSHNSPSPHISFCNLPFSQPCFLWSLHVDVYLVLLF